ncbi:MAG: hypothetical protein A3C61_00185 [Candidatus Yanofskybacteria bacterium RIFCSPHIGHO2_02_FULL_39_10]|uniref:Uncharacterized protein n=1 Tax=Candidatus Yanofskybacteria bacterium RIFCSPHIGHO2_02_FULL_39_10 TaxID=1802674 RepID=A0A1F8FA66_9BACT|nr:MAG: hypothetical protein A3C61_00185 [Candidatus Yanofskybacteria bacterium RIFCSPHIGHO2_02_FULL_39_10]
MGVVLLTQIFCWCLLRFLITAGPIFSESLAKRFLIGCMRNYFARDSKALAQVNALSVILWVSGPFCFPVLLFYFLHDRIRYS